MFIYFIIIIYIIINHTPRAYNSARALRLCGPSAHYYYTGKPCLCSRMKKLHAPVGVLPSGLLTSLRLLARGLSRQQQGEREGEDEEGGKKGGREKERREKEVGQTDRLNSTI